MNKMTINERAMVREYRSEIAEVKGFQDVFLESRSKQAMVFSAKQLKEGILMILTERIIDKLLFGDLDNINIEGFKEVVLTTTKSKEKITMIIKIEDNE